MSKKITNLSIDKTINGVHKSNIFDRLVKEVYVKEIPSEFVESVVVQFYDGNVIELTGDEVTQAIKLSQDFKFSPNDSLFKKMKDVKIFINTDKLADVINEMVEKVLGNYC